MPLLAQAQRMIETFLAVEVPFVSLAKSWIAAEGKLISMGVQTSVLLSPSSTNINPGGGSCQDRDS